MSTYHALQTVAAPHHSRAVDGDALLALGEELAHVHAPQLPLRELRRRRIRAPVAGARVASATVASAPVSALGRGCRDRLLVLQRRKVSTPR